MATTSENESPERPEPVSDESHETHDPVKQESVNEQPQQNVDGTDQVDAPKDPEPDSSKEPPSELQRQITAGKIHSVFGPNAKRGIIFAASIGAFFSPLSANIYMPALDTISKDLRITSSQVNLTVTMYLIFQGIAPTFIGGFSDSAGRRPSYIICFVIYLIANLALALNNTYAGLMVLRCIQSSGSSGTVALANAVVADVVTSAERGTYIGYASVGAILGPALSPVIGGLLSQYLGWHWIFWFLEILAAAYFIPLLFFMPETCRRVVDDGSIPPPRLNQSLASMIQEKRRARRGETVDYSKRDELARHRKLRFPNPLATLVIIGDREASILLVSIGLLYACFYAINTSLTSQFARIYGFDNVQISLMYLPIGVGGLISAFTTGKMLNWNYRRHARRLGLPVDRRHQQDLTGFPIERARLEISLPLLYVAAAAMIVYGWILGRHVNLAGPCILLFVIGYALIAGFNCMGILMVDIYPGSPATATAANNLVRCLLGAAASAVIEPMIKAMGLGWAVTLVALVWVAFSPLLMLLMRWGPMWRKAAKEKKEVKGEERERERSEKDGGEEGNGVENPRAGKDEASAGKEG